MLAPHWLKNITEMASFFASVGSIVGTKKKCNRMCLTEDSIIMPTILKFCVKNEKDSSKRDEPAEEKNFFLTLLKTHRKLRL